jgi:hypothetical protein
MRKIILILVLAVLAFSVEAQDRTVTRTLRPGLSLIEYNGQSGDTLGTTQDTIAFVLKPNSPRPVVHNIEVNAYPNTIDGTYTVDVKLQGRIFNTDSWSDIDATNTGLDATSAITVDFNTDLSDVIDTLATTNHPFYNEFRILIANNTVSGLDAGEQLTVDYINAEFLRR